MREKLTISVDPELYKNLKKLSELTRIPASRLFDEAVEDLLEKHNFIEMLKNKKEKK
jgi:predicted transcriptional regulator